ncbi:SH3 domain-containing protein [Streptomyces gardneri]|uniref:SH3 domain-containing protein n=1 Tax=Streptomyces gardneri TaxID=66892 RepID=UPI0038B69E7C
MNLRSGAGTRHASLGHLTRGDQVGVDRKPGGWYRVTLSERSRSGTGRGPSGGSPSGTSSPRFACGSTTRPSAAALLDSALPSVARAERKGT